MAAGGRTTAGLMPLILDASVLLKLVVDEAGTKEAVALLDRPASRIAPDWVFIEAANALWNKVKYSHLLERHAEEGLKSLARFVDEVVPASELVDNAVSLAFRLRHPVYDTLYLALAVRKDGVVITADRDFAKAASKAGLAEYMELL